MDSEQVTPKVVVTGIGAVTPLGLGIEEYWKNLSAGVSGLRRVTQFDIEPYPCQVAGEVKDFEAADYMDGKEAKRNDRYTHYAVAAARMAVEDGGLDFESWDADRVGVLIGSGIGGMHTIQTQSHRLFEGGPRKLSPFMIPSLIANIASGVVAIAFNAKGPNFSIVSACSTGAHAIGEAMRIIQRGEADIILAGGSEAAITELGIGGFCAMRAMSTKYNDAPETASRPFDAGRDGFVMGDGAGVLVLEREEHAKARGAKIYAELAGYATTCDAHHITMPDPEGAGLAKCITHTLKSAGVAPEDVDYINAHGTSTPYNDKFETAAIKSAFGEHAGKLMVSSTKSMTGHLLGAAGGIEAAASCKVIEQQVVPPTINYTTPDPECDLDYVPNKAREAKVDVVLSNNSGFGGHNASLLFRKHI
ncbi:MAG: beta-ketoacyl-ACP synthase II [Verrucomicrobiota bacterium]